MSAQNRPFSVGPRNLVTRTCPPVPLVETWKPKLTMGHGSTNLGGSRGSWVSTRDPLIHFTLYSSGIPRNFVVHGKPATAMETVISSVY